MESNGKHRRRRVFTPPEDEKLVQIVTAIGCNNWGKVAALMKGRTPRQCRERWITYLSPEVSRQPWTPEEEALLEAKHAELGPKWALIAKSFVGRPDNVIKNHWNAMMRKKASQAESETTELAVGEPTDPLSVESLMNEKKSGKQGPGSDEPLPDIFALVNKKS